MIVDMMRNDLGRIAEVGSIEVPELFTVERYPNVWQMTSLVTARSLASLEEIFAAMHPSASVTGAPKVRTMEILSELESAPRGVYTGRHRTRAAGRQCQLQRRDPDGRRRRRRWTRRVRRRQRHRVGLGRGRRVRRVPAQGVGPWPAPVRFELLETLRWTPEEGYFLARAPPRSAARIGRLLRFRRSTWKPRRRVWTPQSRALTRAQRVRLLVDAGRRRQGRTRRARRTAGSAASGRRRRADRSTERLAVSQDHPRDVYERLARRRLSLTR